MLTKLALVALILAVLAGFFGFVRFSKYSFEFAKVLCFVFVAVSVLLLLVEIIW